MRVQNLLAQTNAVTPIQDVLTSLAQVRDDGDYLYPTAAPGAHAGMPIAGKLGICGNLWRKEQVKNINGDDHVSWFYQYFHWITTDEHIEYANEQGLEFVPMMTQNRISYKGWREKCYLNGRDPEGNPQERCDKERILREMKESINKLDVPVRYFIGLNEPFDTNPDLPNKWVEPREASALWGEYWMPIAEELGLTLVSPTTIMKADKASWFADFLKGCWELRDAEENHCDVETIEIFNIHHYSCVEKHYYDAYDPDPVNKKNFYGYLISKLTDPEWEGHDQFDWESWIMDRPIWVTETSCQADAGPGFVSQQE